MSTTIIFLVLITGINVSARNGALTGIGTISRVVLMLCVVVGLIRKVVVDSSR